MRGDITISLELELGWGMHDMGEFTHLSSGREYESDTLDWLLDLCNEYKIPISFDVVGHLFLDECTGHHEGPHPIDWWSEDPGTNAGEQPLFYAPDMISKIAEQPVDHEICTHTFSHALADEMSDEILDHELRMSRKVFADSGYPRPVSIVLPRHQSVAPEVLRDNGIETVRTPFKWSGRSDKLASYGWWLLRHPVGQPERHGEIVKTFCTPFPSLTSVWLPQGNGIQPPTPAKFVPVAARRRWHERYLKSAVDRAAECGASVHLWSHLHNVSNRAQWSPISNCIEHIAARRDEGAISVRRMCDIPEEI